MTPFERLSGAFDRGLSDGLESLSEEDLKLYLIQDFIIEQEMNGFSGYFYNRLPNLKQISSTMDAMKEYGLLELAGILNEAFQLFREYVDPKSETTWEEVLRRYDPKSQLEVLENKINSLDDYGLANSGIQ